MNGLRVTAMCEWEGEPALILSGDLSDIKSAAPLLGCPVSLTDESGMRVELTDGEEKASNAAGAEILLLREMLSQAREIIGEELDGLIESISVRGEVRPQPEDEPTLKAIKKMNSFLANTGRIKGTQP